MHTSFCGDNFRLVSRISSGYGAQNSWAWCSHVPLRICTNKISEIRVRASHRTFSGQMCTCELCLHAGVFHGIKRNQVSKTDEHALDQINLKRVLGAALQQPCNAPLNVDTLDRAAKRGSWGFSFKLREFCALSAMVPAFFCIKSRQHICKKYAARDTNEIECRRKRCFSSAAYNALFTT